MSTTSTPQDRPRASPAELLAAALLARRKSDAAAHLALLLAAVAGGDRAALGQVYDALAPAVLALARSQVPDDGAAQSVVVATFRLVWQESPRRAATCRDVTAWVLALTHRCAKEHR